MNGRRRTVFWQSILLVSGALQTLSSPARGQSCTAPATGSWTESSSPSLHRALADEMKRGLTELSLPGMPGPYFASSTVIDEWGTSASATLGALVHCDSNRNRSLIVDVRVGSYAFDNTNFLGESASSEPSRLTADDDSLAIRRAVWLTMDAQFKAAASSYEAKSAARQALATAEKRPHSFSQQPPTRWTTTSLSAPEAPPRFASLAKELSGKFRDAEWIQESGVIVSSLRDRITLVSTEGSVVVQPRSRVVVIAWAAVQAPDGMWLRHHQLFWAESLDALPGRQIIEAGISDLIATLENLRRAPIVSNYSGPVLFEGTAAAQLLEHLLAAELTGTPAPEAPAEFGGQSPSLLSRVGLRLLPTSFSVVDDPSLAQWRGENLMGHYRLDDEGVEGSPVTVVQHGRLVGLPMSRTPSSSFELSNGHGRRAYTNVSNGVASNLIVSSHSGLTHQGLRRKLLDLAKAESLPYAFVVKALEEPLVARLTARGNSPRMPNRPGTLPKALLVYRLSPDGTEELVRGAAFDSIRLQTLRDIAASSSARAVYHSPTLAFMAATESGSPGQPGLSIVSPDLLFAEIDVLAPLGPEPRLPALDPPAVRAGTTGTQ